MVNSTWSHKNMSLCALFVRHYFYVPYFTLCSSFKEKCPLNGAKTQVQGSRFFIRPILNYTEYNQLWNVRFNTVQYGSIREPWHVFIMLLQKRIEVVQNSNIRGLLLKVNALSCWKYALHQIQPDSVIKCKTDTKTYLLMQPCYLNFLLLNRFDLFCRTVVTRDLNRSSSLLKYSVNYRTNLPSMKTCRYEAGYVRC